MVSLLFREVCIALEELVVLLVDLREEQLKVTPFGLLQCALPAIALEEIDLVHQVPRAVILRCR